MANAIRLKNYLNIEEWYEADEAGIRPGMLLEYSDDGEVKKHGTANNDVIPMLALTDRLQGKGINEAYANGSPVQCWIPQPGDQAYMILADGQDISVGAYLQSNGDGTLKAVTSGGVAFCQALEAVDLSGSSGELDEDSDLGYNSRIKVRITGTQRSA